MSCAACSDSSLVSSSRKIPLSMWREELMLNVFPFAAVSWERKWPSQLWGFLTLSGKEKNSNGLQVSFFCSDSYAA